LIELQGLTVRHIAAKAGAMSLPRISSLLDAMQGARDSPDLAFFCLHASIHSLREAPIPFFFFFL
jgi:hypothetical protein